jgi:hypothetical protein
MRMYAAIVGLTLFGCGRIGFDAVGDVVGTDIPDAPTQDTRSPDALSANYCDGWTYCDTFDGGPSIAWKPVVFGQGASVAPSTLRAASGTTSLLAHRDAGRGSNDFAVYSLEVNKLAECEFDVFVEQTFTPEVEVAYMKLSNPSLFNYLSPATASFTTAGFVGRWGSNTINDVKLGGMTPLYNTQPTRGIWLHVALRNGYQTNTVASSEISINSSSGNPETKTLIFPAGFAYQSHILQIGMYADSPQVLNIFFDNVRCR